MSRRVFHRFWRVARYVRTWHLIVLLVLCSLASVELLRQNSLGMIERKNEVKMADEQGDQQKIQAALAELQRYVSMHMNTSMGDKGIYLEKTYQRAYERAVQDNLTHDVTGRTLYDQADAACQSVFNKTYSFPAYTQCVAGKLSVQAGGHDPLSVVKPPAVDLFRYNFVSPGWSPDAAGIAVLVSVLLIVALLARLLLALMLGLILRLRQAWL
jgi:hypothetical protein